MLERNLQKLIILERLERRSMNIEFSMSENSPHANFQLCRCHERRVVAILHKNVDFWTLNHQRLYILDVFQAWDYARTISRSKKLHIACPKTHRGTKTTYLVYFWKSCMYVNHACMLCVFYVYVCIIFIICMYGYPSPRRPLLFCTKQNLWLLLLLNLIVLWTEHNNTESC